MTTIALFSWWKDSFFSIIEAQKQWIVINIILHFIDEHNYSMFDWWPQTSWNNLLSYASFFWVKKVESIILKETVSIQDRYDQVASILLELVNNTDLQLIHWDLFYPQSLWDVMKKRIPSIKTFCAYDIHKTPIQYIDAYKESGITSIITGTRFEKISPFLGRQYNKETIDTLLSLWYSLEEILWEDDELQTAVIWYKWHTFIHCIAYIQWSHKVVNSPYNNHTYRIM